MAKSKRWLPLEWWKLSLLWFLNLKSRSPRSEVALFPSSLKVALLGLSLGVASLSLTLMIVTGFERTLAKAVIQSSGHITHHTHGHPDSEHATPPSPTTGVAIKGWACYLGWVAVDDALVLGSLWS